MLRSSHSETLDIRGLRYHLRCCGTRAAAPRTLVMLHGWMDVAASFQFVVDALTPISDFNERFGADFDDDEYDTIGGLLTAAIGHLPEAGEELSMGRFVFRVATADARRVHAFHVDVLGNA